ncbi:collagen alpha-1(I) chain-like [Orcinus orca]|uniref:collagen alpha-1(I) chain-like n=1 Tax=Orcinus orca TaxID=9733 RepID=UPI0021123CC2|nr:collagen alpha-1(I) chain-like [Orcinus orca]
MGFNGLPAPAGVGGAARNLGGPGAGPRAPAGRSGGRPARARSPALTRSHGRGAAGARAEARPPLTSPPARRERGAAGTAAGPRRPAGVPTTRARASAPGRGAARQGDGRRSPQPRPTRNDAGGRAAAAAAADHGAAPRQAREAKHTGTRPGGRQTRRTGRMDGRETGPTRRGWLGRRRGGAATTSRKTWRAGADARRREGGPGAHPKGTDASRPPGHDTGSHRQRPPAQGRSRGTQDADWPPRPPTRAPPLAGLAPTTAKHPRAAASPATTTLSRAHTGRPTCPATRLRRRARLPRLRDRKRSRGEATRTVPTHRPRPRLAARAGATGSSRLRDWGVGTSVRPRTPPRARHRRSPHAHATRAHTATRRTPAWRDPPPTQRGEARAAVGKERRSAPPRGRRKPSREGEGLCRPRGSGGGHRGHRTLGRGSGWGVRYPKAPSRIAREGFSHRGCVIPHPSSLPFGPTEALHEPPSPRLAVGGVGGGLRYGPRPNTIAPTPACDSPHTHKWGAAAHAASARPRKSHSRDTPPRRRPRGARWEKGTTPPLGLARLRDDLERSRGTTEDRASHAHAPAAGARRSGGTAPTDAGRTAREAHAEEAKRERLLRPRTTAPPTP